MLHCNLVEQLSFGRLRCGGSLLQQHVAVHPKQESASYSYFSVLSRVMSSLEVNVFKIVWVAIESCVTGLLTSAHNGFQIIQTSQKQIQSGLLSCWERSWRRRLRTERVWWKWRKSWKLWIRSAWSIIFCLCFTGNLCPFIEFYTCYQVFYSSATKQIRWNEMFVCQFFWSMFSISIFFAFRELSMMLWNMRHNVL